MLTNKERQEWSELDAKLMEGIFRHTLSTEEKDAIRSRIAELRSKISIISIGEYLKLPRDLRPKHLRHLPDAGLAKNEYVTVVTADMWTRTKEGHSWCNHGGTELEIISEGDSI